MSRLFALALTAGALVFAASSDGNKCTEFSPCSREGYCDANAMFCMWDLCDPTKSYNATSCWQPEGCLDQTIEFASSSDVVPIRQYSGNPNTNALVSIFEPDNSKIEDGKLVLDMTYDSAQDKGFGTTVHSSHSFQYGTVTARIKSASIAKGVVSAFIIRSDLVGDEIDFEWVGKDPNSVETNIFYHDILNYSNSRYFDIGGDTSAEYHDYTIVWDPDFVQWAVDGKTLRTFKREDTYNKANDEYRFPAAEGRVGLSIWDGGNSGPEGTEEWAGTPTPWTPSTVYQMFVESITIKCSGSHPASSDTAEPQSSTIANSDSSSENVGVSSSDADETTNEATDSSAQATDSSADGTSDSKPSDNGDSDSDSPNGGDSDSEGTDSVSPNSSATSSASDEGSGSEEQTEGNESPGPSSTGESEAPSSTGESAVQSATDAPSESTVPGQKCKVVTIVRPL
ncbi:putative glycosidase CRH2 [Coemansia sp. RSA 1972]|nr:putative glycosidase CRH2 [Coemansia sp. RSA 1972]